MSQILLGFKALKYMYILLKNWNKNGKIDSRKIKKQNLKQ